jgi:hypothetical protein
MTATEASASTRPSESPHVAIQSLIAEARRELAELDAQIEPLVVKRRVVLERMNALEHVDRLYRDPATPADESVAPSGDGGSEVPPLVPAYSFPSSGTVRDTVRGRVKAILSESADDAMHINAIAEQFGIRGWNIPGQGKPANLTAHLSHAPDIYSPRRGFWTVGPNPEVGKKRATRRTARRKPRGSR